MVVKVTPDMKEEVAPQLLDFVHVVLEGEQLSDWDVHIWACRSEGLCDDTTIMFGLCEIEIKTKLLFLHEVAHALRNHLDWDDSYWHRDGWDREYGRLCGKYLGATPRDYRKLRSLFV